MEGEVPKIEGAAEKIEESSPYKKKSRQSKWIREKP